MVPLKVRYTTRCAGGCGRRLTPGQHATRRHRTLWCAACSAVHRGRCGACGGGATPAVPVPPQGTLF